MGLWARHFIILAIGPLFFLINSCTFFNKQPADHPALLAIAAGHCDQLTRGDSAAIQIYLDSLFAHIGSTGPGDRYARYDILRKYYAEKLNNPARALLYIDSMIGALKPYAASPLYNRLYAGAHLVKGDLLFGQKRFDDAYIEFYTAKTSILDGDDICKNPQFFFEFYKRLGDISYGKGLFLDAARWHKRAIGALQQCGSDTTHAYDITGSMNNIGLSYYNAEELDSARIYFEKALLFVNTHMPKDSMGRKGFTEARGVILGNLGSAYYKLGRADSARRQFEESIAINSKPGYAGEDAMITRIKLADLYINANDLPKASALMTLVNRVKDTLKSPYDQLLLTLLNASYHTSKGEATEAGRLYQQYISQLGALRSAKAHLMSADFTKEFELLKKEYDLESLKKQDELKNFYLFISIMVSMMALAIIYLVYKSSRQARQQARLTILHNEQLNMALNALEETSAQNAQVLSIVAHDLKNPISAIYAISDIMVNETGRSAEDTEMLELIKTSSQNLNILIRDLLASRIKRLPETEIGPVDLRMLIQESIALLQYLAEGKGIKIVFEESASPLVNINRDRIWRVINNLVVNAIKFSNHKSVVKVSFRLQEKEVVVCVADQGIGIPEALMDKIFQLSKEVKRPGTSGEETHGLGLYISKQIIEDHDGRIWVTSTVGQGTSFYFSLPLMDLEGE